MGVRVGIGVLMVLVALGVLVGASTIVSSITRSEETADVFTDAAEVSPDLLESVTWRPDSEGLARPIEPLTRAAVTTSWLQAWEQLRIVAETGDTTGVDVYFSNSARQGVLARADGWDQSSIRQLGHDLELTFYSEDGQILGLTSVETRVLRTELIGDELWARQSIESYDAVLLLEDGNWRINHWVRRTVEPGEWSVGPD